MSMPALVRRLAVLALVATAALAHDSMTPSHVTATPICEQAHVVVLGQPGSQPGMTCIPYGDATICNSQDLGFGSTFDINNYACVPRP